MDELESKRRENCHFVILVLGIGDTIFRLLCTHVQWFAHSYVYTAARRPLTYKYS